MNVVDSLYNNPHVLLCTGLVMTTLVTFTNKVRLCLSIEYYSVTCIAFLAALLLYDENPLIPFMLGTLLVRFNKTHHSLIM
jgi:hypothetical protein